MATYLKARRREVQEPSAESIVSEASWNLLDHSLTLWFLDGTGVIVCRCSIYQAVSIAAALRQSFLTWEEAQAVLSESRLS